jgi:hypothetical protein
LSSLDSDSAWTADDHIIAWVSICILWSWIYHQNFEISGFVSLESHIVRLSIRVHHFLHRIKANFQALCNISIIILEVWLNLVIFHNFFDTKEQVFHWSCSLLLGWNLVHTLILGLKLFKKVAGVQIFPLFLINHMSITFS